MIEEYIPALIIAFLIAGLIAYILFSNNDMNNKK